MLPVNRKVVNAIRSSANDSPRMAVRSSSVSEQADCIFTVTGNGMAPLIKDGDNVLVSFTDELSPGDIGVFLTEHGMAIRQYYKEGLRSFRPDQEQFHIGSDTKYSVIGRYLGLVLPEDIRH